MAAVLVLGLLYTVLAGAAMRGLRSEGVDHRRADAELVVDQELSAVQAEIAAGAVLKDGTTERDEEPFRVRVEIEPTDVLALLPAKLGEEIARTTDPRAPSVLHDERGQSRLRRVSVFVEWDEAGQLESVERTTYSLDKASLAQLFPSESGGANAGAQSKDNSLDALRKDAPPELQQMMGGQSQKQSSSLRPTRRTRPNK
jgi:hypothetical protein